MSDYLAVVILNHGRWVAACPRPFCGNGECAGTCDDGSTGGLDLRDGTFHCREVYGGCGITCPAQWPPNVAEIEALVMPRPVPATRNWRPGETLSELLQENMVHGIVPTLALEGRPGLLVAAYGDQLVGPALEWAPRPELEA